LEDPDFTIEDVRPAGNLKLDILSGNETNVNHHGIP
jgi:hypothetical protein